MKTPTMLLLFAFCLWSFVPATLEARDRDTVDYYFKEAEKVLSQGDRSQALRLFETALSYVNNKNGKKNEYQYTELLDYLAVLKCEVGEVDQAIAYEDEVILWRREHKSDFGVIGDAVSKKAVFYSYKKDYDAAIKYAEEAADLLRRRFGEKDHVYSVNLMNLASYYSLRGAGAQDYQKAVEVGERAIKHIDNYAPEYAYTASRRRPFRRGAASSAARAAPLPTCSPSRPCVWPICTTIRRPSTTVSRHATSTLPTAS